MDGHVTQEARGDVRIQYKMYYGRGINPRQCVDR